MSKKNLPVNQVLSQAQKAAKKGNIPLALELYHSILQLYPTHMSAKKALNKLQKKITVKPSAKTLPQDPGQEQIKHLINFYNSGEFKTAEDECQKLIHHFPNSSVLFNILGAVLQKQKKSQKAVKAFDKAIRIEPGNAEFFNNKGIALRDTGLFSEAVKNYDMAIKLHPGYAEAYSNKGVALRDIGQIDDAIKNYSKAIKIKPDYATAFNNRGVAFYELNNTQMAVEDYIQAISLMPEYTEAYCNYGIVLSESAQKQQALQQFKKAIDLKPDYFEAHLRYAQTLFDLGMTEKAAKTYTRLLLIYPDSAEAHNSLGDILKVLGKTQEAYKHFEQATHLMPEYAEALNNQALLLEETNELEAAFKKYEKAIECSSENSQIFYNYGAALYKDGRLKSAEYNFKKATQLSPDFAEAYNAFGAVAGDLGQFETSMKNYTKALELKPEFAQAYNNCGNTLKNFGKTANAMENYEMAIKIQPDFAEAHRNLSTIKKYGPNDPQIETIQRLMSNPNIEYQNQMQLNFALAKIYEDLEEYGTSFDYLKAGNNLKKKQLNYTIENDKKIFSEVMEIFKSVPEMDIDNSPYTCSVRPIFIVGMPRSGTTLVEQILASHSKVHGAGEMETFERMMQPIMVNSFNRCTDDSKTALRLNESKSLRKGYLEEILKTGVSEPVITDKMPTNFKWIGYIFTAFPEAKIIHVTRDPRATCWSIYKHYFSSKGNGYAYDLDQLADFYHLYQNIMAFWQQLFPGRIYELNYETLTENQEKETHKLLSYCDLEWERECLEFYKTQRSVRTASADQVRKKMYTGSSTAWKMYEPQLKKMIEALGF